MSRLKKDYDLRLKLLRKQDNAETVSRSDNKSKTLWQIINSERKSKDEKSLPLALDIHGKHVQEPKLIADHLNTFFTNIAHETIQLNGHTNLQKITPAENFNVPTLILQPTNREEMTKLIQSLKVKTSTGYDNVSTRLLKICKEELVDPLTEIINSSFSQGIFPSALKIAKVYPKYKQGPTTQPSNYRPISLIPTFSKVIEKLVLNRILEHLSMNQLLTPYQHGFLPGRSTTTALISLVEFLADQLEDGNTSTAIFLDYSKAFDCLSHDHLLSKLATLGIQGQSLEWFRSYLTGRSQMTEVKYTTKGITRQICSGLQAITRGVPQGSVLGPVLFILYTNDFPQYMEDFSSTLMYADDTVLLLGKTNQEELEIAAYTAVNMAVQYCHGNDLVVNETKTKQLFFGRHKDTVGGLPELEEISTSKYLGVTIDDSLTWTHHIDNLCKRLSAGLYVIRRMKHISDLRTAKTAYYALYESHLRYGIAVWGGTTLGNLQRVLIHQKRAIRILASLRTRESCRQAFQELKILTVVNLYILEAVTYVHLKSPDEVMTGAQQHDYNTRHAANYHLPAHRLASTEKKPTYVGAKLWHALPLELKRRDRLQFGHKLKLWLQDHPFYTINEFLNCTVL
uniref:Reverse transcriptase domain-containing protein n=1 Tax=Homalodisca liturata TaxID=320908 RepID=A0A1B6HDX7_9HEMI